MEHPTRDRYTAGMSPELRIVRPSSPGRQVLTLIPLILCCLVVTLSTRSIFIGSIVGSGAYLIYRIAFIRWIIKRAHLRGIRENLRGNYESAMNAFVESEEFWGNHRRLDRYRAILLGEAGAYPFLFMARFNRAISLIHLYRASEAAAILDELLKEDPTNTMVASLKSAIGDGNIVHPPSNPSSNT